MGHAFQLHARGWRASIHAVMAVVDAARLSCLELRWCSGVPAGSEAAAAAAGRCQEALEPRRGNSCRLCTALCAGSFLPMGPFLPCTFLPVTITSSCGSV